MRTIGFEQGEMIAQDHRAVRRGCLRRLYALFLPVQVGGRADPNPQQIIPPTFENRAENGTGAASEYEPEEDESWAELLPRNLSVQVFRALLENAASEQGARMSAMDNATRNAGEMIRKQHLPTTAPVRR